MRNRAAGSSPRRPARRRHRARTTTAADRAEIHAVRRLRTLSGRPVMVERTAYPSAVGELIASLPPHTVVLEESGVLFADAQHTIDLCLDDAEDARLLDCRPGDPLLRERRCSTHPAGTPIGWSEDRCLAETVAFTVHSSATSGSLARRSSDET
ncbi:UTRA domain-containing protein [Streptomyces hokutonensis]|uniref:UTRA domain-containing protein n=1 Tax=Streptomyces hokutonensis TaxID=1306990 RepID=UPI0037F4B98C